MKTGNFREVSGFSVAAKSLFSRTVPEFTWSQAGFFLKYNTEMTCIGKSTQAAYFSHIKAAV